MGEEAFTEPCPVCRQKCNCKACLRLDGPIRALKNLKYEVNKEEQVQYSKFILQKLLPFLRKLSAKQLEFPLFIWAGSPVSKINLQKGKCHENERMYCNNCKTSIVDYHRNCSSCSYDLCLFVGSLEMVTLRELKKSSLNSLTKGMLICMKSRTPENSIGPAGEWKSNADGSISCPTENFGGCGKGILELKCLLSKSKYPVSELLAKAEDIAKRCELEHMPEISQGSCLCIQLVDETDMQKSKLRKALSPDNSDDNYLYCPAAKDLQQEDLKHFQCHWLKGEPVIVGNVLETASGLSWEPMVMWQACRQIKNINHPLHLDVSAINCLDWCEMYMLGAFFHDG
ncbi:lysine-specific demethylase JMJ25-like [Lycium barbarum]|uniref:lysine-specific demethylase JMJ25-like n=1 Tax=Lycium barbarum TaxID=112863 RepID=UPI00293F2799|nr:lysine-specific demethylase JMJ25-like [Lycium barbarum]